jgi:N-sulfoglucosamine sulfohydrolase
MRTLLLLLLACALSTVRGSERPNIIWIVGEDLGPELGCYGDPQAITPNMDRIAKEGARFTRCFTHAPVCAPSRHGLITGQYPIKTGAHHMRSTLVNRPELFTEILRKAGYFVAWPGKTDFNFNAQGTLADTRENWLNSPPPAQPFFAYINFTQTHESQIRNDGGKFDQNTARLKPEQRHDPAKLNLPPFWPDSPEVRRELANYYDLVTAIDYLVGDVLKWIDDHRLKENTIVMFFGDHGRGMARYKRWVYDTGTHVPLMIRWPGKVAPGSVREDLVEFLDLTATTVSLAGAPVPASFDGQVFLGPNSSPERKYVHAHRDYMDETYDRIRSVRDKRFRYIRNFAPELPYAQEIDYMEMGKTMQVWRRMHAEGKLNEAQSRFFAASKPTEELYDTEQDPFELQNLAGDPQHLAKLEELRKECDAWLARTGDKGAIPVDELISRGIIRPRDPKYLERAKTPATKH